MIYERLRWVTKLVAASLLVAGVFWILFYLAAKLWHGGPLLPEPIPDVPPEMAWAAFTDVTSVASFIAAVVSIGTFKIQKRRGKDNITATLTAVIGIILILVFVLVLSIIFQIAIETLLSVVIEAILGLINLIFLLIAALLMGLVDIVVSILEFIASTLGYALSIIVGYLVSIILLSVLAVEIIYVVDASESEETNTSLPDIFKDLELSPNRIQTRALLFASFGILITMMDLINEGPPHTSALLPLITSIGILLMSYQLGSSVSDWVEFYIQIRLMAFGFLSLVLSVALLFTIIFAPAIPLLIVLTIGLLLTHFRTFYQEMDSLGVISQSNHELNQFRMESEASEQK